jgi:aspartyl-tRNA(Asn)/glutamyl-tRNA(Gln) amidotransferase subunit A
VPLPALAHGIAAYAVIAAVEAASNLARFDGVRYGPRVAAATYEETVAASRRAGFGEEVRRRILFGIHAATAGGAASLERRARALAATLGGQLLAALAACDLLATPTAPSVAFPLGERKTDPLAMYRSDVFTVPANLAGLPAISLPAGVADHGLPFGVQLTGRPFDEPLLLRAAAAFETAG